MISFVTDMREGETDILASNKLRPLRITTLDGLLIEQVTPPAKGWTHAALLEQGRRLTPKVKHGADAYLGTQWVGSTEV